MGEGERPLRPLGTRNDYSHLLRFLDDREEFVNIDLANRGKKLKAETAPDHCGSDQHPLFVLIEPLQAAADDQAHVFRNVNFVDLDIRAELPSRIENFPFFDQMPINLLNEKWISLAFLKDEAHQIFGSLALAQTM